MSGRYFLSLLFFIIQSFQNGHQPLLCLFPFAMEISLKQFSHDKESEETRRSCISSWMSLREDNLKPKVSYLALMT